MSSRGRKVTEEYLQYVDGVVKNYLVNESDVKEKIAEIITSNDTTDAVDAIFKIMRRVGELEAPQNPCGRTATFEQTANRAIDEVCEQLFG
jgi:hypothetical protein